MLPVTVFFYNQGMKNIRQNAGYSVLIAGKMRKEYVIAKRVTL